jgi:hypothetical protein
MMHPGLAIGEVVEVRAADGLTMRGERWEGDPERRAVIVHDADEDLDSVRALALAMVGAGFMTLAVDQIGHGVSDGEPDPDRLSADLRSVIDVFTRPDRGVYLIGVGRAAVGCLEVAASVHPSALAVVSPRDLGRLPASVIEGDGAPILVAYGSWDETADTTARQLVAARPGPFQLVQLPTRLQATALLRDELGAQVTNHAVGYLRQVVPLQRTEAPDAADE